MHIPPISPKLAAGLAPPLTAVVSALILTGTLDRTSLAALAAIVIGAVLGYHAPRLEPASSSLTVPSAAAETFTGDADDGDDALPAELVDHPITTAPPADEIDSPDQTQED